MLLNFAERTGSGAVNMVWSCLQTRLNTQYTYARANQNKQNDKTHPTPHDACTAQPASCRSTIAQLTGTEAGRGWNIAEHHAANQIKCTQTSSIYNNINTTNQNDNAIAQQHTRSMPEHTCAYTWLKDINLIKKKQPYHNKHNTAVYGNNAGFGQLAVQRCAYLSHILQSPPTILYRRKAGKDDLW